jgi:hypothetical protein
MVAAATAVGRAAAREAEERVAARVEEEKEEERKVEMEVRESAVRSQRSHCHTHTRRLAHRVRRPGKHRWMPSFALRGGS